MLRPPGSIPAYTGETLFSSFHETPAGVYPRIYGGNCPAIVMYGREMGLSPHIRGKLNGVDLGVGFDGSIPAYTGETRPGC